MPFSWDRSFHALNAFNRFAGFDFAFASLPPSHSLSLPRSPSAPLCLASRYFLCFLFQFILFSAAVQLLPCILSAFRRNAKHIFSLVYICMCVRVCAPFAEPFLSDLPTTFATSSRLLAAAYNATLHTPLTRLPSSSLPLVDTCHTLYVVCVAYFAALARHP